MKSFYRISFNFLLSYFSFCYGCQSKTENVNEGLGKENTKQPSNMAEDRN